MGAVVVCKLQLIKKINFGWFLSLPLNFPLLLICSDNCQYVEYLSVPFLQLIKYSARLSVNEIPTMSSKPDK